MLAEIFGLMTPPKVLLEDDFRQGLNLTGTPSGTGLVPLEPPCTFPAAFAGGPPLFRQGAELQVGRFEIDSAAGS